MRGDLLEEGRRICLGKEARAERVSRGHIDFLRDAHMDGVWCEVMGRATGSHQGADVREWPNSEVNHRYDVILRKEARTQLICV